MRAMVGLPALAAAAFLGLTACAGTAAGPVTPTPQPQGGASTPATRAPVDTIPFRGVPGFDTRTYPGDAVMQSWRAESPYRWVGYYLPAPCRTDSSWVGRRAALEQGGWGLALVFVGEQDWGAAATVAGPSARTGTPPTTPAGGAPGSAAPADSGGAAPAAAPRCTRSNLTAEKGRADAGQADSLAAREGFPQGTAIFLDVERVDSVSTPLASYVRGWVGELLKRGRYLPALYLHARNLEALRPILQSELATRGRTEPPRLWVAGGSAPFDVHAAPSELGAGGVSVWQGAHDVRESHGGVTLRIDVNVADGPAPSAPAGAGASR